MTTGAAPIVELQPENGWIVLAEARLPPPARSERSLLFRGMATLTRFLGRPEVPDIFSVLSKNARLFWPWLLFASRLMPYGRLPAAVREKIILRTAWNCRSRYEWGQHVDIALAVGVSDAEIVRVAAGPDACAEAHERAILRACDELFRDKCITDATWHTLAEKYNEALLIEIVILVGHYEMLAGFLNSAGTRLEPPIGATLQQFQRRILPLP